METKRTVRNCPETTFRMRCSMSWEALDATDRAEVRHCGRCDCDVYFCRTDEETLAHAKAGHCIAREGPDQLELPVVVLGLPAAIVPEFTESQKDAVRWKSREAGIDDSLHHASRSKRACPRCSYPAPDWRTTCRVCGFAMGRSSGWAES